jgi:hypothetical protein
MPLLFIFGQIKHPVELKSASQIELIMRLFQMIPGLWGDGSYVSFESATHPGFYVCRKGDGTIQIMRGNTNDDGFRRSGSFKEGSH